MRKPPFALWRLFFVLSALLLLAGGPQHPGGTMAEMLAHPAWVPSHALMLTGFVALLAGLILYLRDGELPDKTRTWGRLAVIGTALQVVEMVFHTAAAVDHAHLVAGEPTPILTTHLVLAVVFNPVFGLTLAGFVLAGMRERVLGSPWIGWLGVLGVLAYGAAAPLVIVLEAEWARVLFPLITLFALWLALAALWPVRAAQAAAPSAVPVAAAGDRI